MGESRGAKPLVMTEFDVSACTHAQTYTSWSLEVLPEVFLCMFFF